MASTISAAYKGGAPSTTQTDQRSVEDTIRDLFPAYSLFTALVARGQSKNGQPVESKGMITKRSVTNRRYENYTYTPLAIEFTVGSGLSSTTLTLVSTTGLVARMTIFNTKNGTTAQIDSVTSTTVVEITSFGSTAFSVASGDILLAMAPAYEQYSSSPAILSKNEDAIYNVLQRVRFSVAIDAVESQTPRHIAGNYWKRMKEVNIREGKRKLEGTMLFSNRASSGNGTAGGAVVGATNSFETTQGGWHWAANSMDANGSMTPEMFRKELPKKFTNGVVGPDDRVIMFCGAEINGQVQEWANDRQIMIEDGTKDIVGIKTKKFQTSQFAVEIVMHDLFNRGSLQNKALLFVPDNLEYVYFKGEDMRPESDIQLPSTDGFQDEWKGSVGFGCKDAGQTMLTISNWY